LLCYRLGCLAAAHYAVVVAAWLTRVVLLLVCCARSSGSSAEVNPNKKQRPGADPPAYPLAGGSRLTLPQAHASRNAN